MTEATKSDAEAQLEAIDAEIATLTERTADVRSQHSAASKKLEIARTLQGSSIADGRKLEADVHAKKASDLAQELEGLSAGLAALDERLTSSRGLRASLVEDITASNLSAKRSALRETSAAVDRAVRAFARGELAQLVAAYRAARREAADAWAQKRALDRKAGRAVEHQIQNPGDENFAGFTHLGAILETLERYGGGQMGGQDHVRESQQIAQTIGSALRDAALQTH